MDRLDAMRIFVSVVDEGSLAASARRLQRSPASVTRAVAFLERHTGATLLQRSTRAMRLTQAGESYLTACRNVIAELDRVERSVGGDQAELRGGMTVTAPATFGRLHVRPGLEGFLDAHPRIEMHLLLMDRVVSLVEEGFDAAFRIGHLPDSSLSAVKLGQVRRLICASPAYLARHPPLRGPADLPEHACIVVSESAADTSWRFSDPASASASSAARGRPKLVRLRARLKVNDAWAAVASAAEGHGIVRLMSYQAERELRAGRLVRVLQRFESAPVPVHLLTSAQRPPAARIRALIDYAIPVFRAVLAKIETVLDG